MEQINYYKNLIYKYIFLFILFCSQLIIQFICMQIMDADTK
jgi:hypothetical protein